MRLPLYQRYYSLNNNARRRRWRQNFMPPPLLLLFIFVLFAASLQLLQPVHAIHRSSNNHNNTPKNKSYYDILGVPKTATDKDIKKAYRKLAIQHHPDKGGDEEQFKEISKAYQTLSNDGERNIYDQYGEAGLEMGAGPSAAAGNFGFGGSGNNGNTNPFAGGSGGNPFQSFFSSQGSNGGGGPGFHTETFSFGGMEQNGNIDISELLRQMMGGNEGGAAAGGGGGPFQQFRRRQQQQQSTTSTSPQTYTQPLRCTLEDLATGATKRRKITFQGREEVYTIHVKPGWKAGTKLTYKGKGQGFPTMVFEIEEIPHKFLQRKGNDLYFVCWIDPSQIKGGIQIGIPLPTGETYTCKIPKATAADGEVDDDVISHGERLVIPNKGMPISKGGPNKRGNLVIEFRVRSKASSSSSSSKPSR